MSHGLARLIAFYLPQFHPIPENDRWWGRGFTEWANVAKARPLFPGHDQPHIPGDLGFYDLRVPETRQAQADLARSHGIEAFCYWHYWFHGKRLLNRPFDEVLASGKPDFPFCLAWANESWSRRWLGEEKDVLIRQTYSPADDIAHAQWLTKAFADRRYLRVEGRPVFLIYRPSSLPNPRATAGTLHKECTKAGLPRPYLVGINAFGDVDYRTLGFEANLQFEPQLQALQATAASATKVYDYVAARKEMAAHRRSHPAYPCIMVSWDNTPRRGAEGVVFKNSTPAHFEAGLRELIDSVSGKPHDQRLIFINAWNEWAEGNHLEPDLKNGRAFLGACRRANAPIAEKAAGGVT